ncbi:uncharacterized protein LOC124149199 [Haliotis rufescens]|uniref:uncharacterized protein LOC124149199 n=1 Tax=Haliotis rufescens TaxID=6454 RepID=UPI00201F943D|nr:uncharacterized protein LOC124149199 [Haliotis rufescens]
METQHSAKFFNSFLEHVQLLCKSYLTFDQVVEVSGYICLDLDNCKKERYVLSELVQKQGQTVSESFCTKVLKTVQGAGVKTAHPTAPTGAQDKENTPRDGSVTQLRCGSEERQPSVRSQCVPRERSVESVFPSRDVNESVRQEASMLRGVELTERTHREQQDTTGPDGAGHQQLKGESDDQDENIEIKQEVFEDEVVQGSAGLCNQGNRGSWLTSLGAQQLKERINIVSNAKMSLQRHSNLSTSSTRVNRSESQERPYHVPPISTIFSPSATATSSVSNSMPVNLLRPGMFMTSRTNGLMPTSSTTQNASFPFPSVLGRGHIDDSMLDVADVDWGEGHPAAAQQSLFGLNANYQVHDLINTPCRWSRKRRGNPTYRVKQNWRYAVRQFENFLRFKGQEVIPINTIPASQLDGMLCEFLQWVKKSNGEDFHPWSMKNFFYHLECHLKEAGYANSITKDVEFQNSRDVLKRRITELQLRLHPTGL